MQDHKPTWGHGYQGDCIYHGNFPGYEKTAVWEECVNRISEFPSLTGVSIIYDRHGASSSTGDFDDEEILHSREKRHAMLKRILQALGTQIKHLSLRHFQDIIEAPYLGDLYSTYRRAEFEKESELAFAADNAFRESILGGLETLQLSMVHMQPHGESGSTLNVRFSNGGVGCLEADILQVTDIHDCWKQFPSRWLLPATSSLKRLEIYSDFPLGWYPKLDLRGVHFPKLESLALGHFIFSRDVQFDWIITHSQSLEELFFDNCSILYQIGHDAPPEEHWLDGEGCPRFHRHNRQEVSHFASYATRWHGVFDLFSHSLTKLKAISFGSSPQWDFDIPNRYDDGTPGLPIMPWRAERNMKNDMFVRRYLIYSNLTERYRADWRTPIWTVDEEGRHVEDVDAWTWETNFRNPPEVLPEMDERPGCDDEDWMAFRALQSNIGQI